MSVGRTRDKISTVTVDIVRFITIRQMSLLDYVTVAIGENENCDNGG